MKNALIFIGGFISGIVFLIVVSICISESASNNGMTYFDRPGECLSTNSFEVLQVIGDGMALAYEIDKSYSSYNTHTELLVLFTNDNGEYYYDNQIIKIPSGKCVRQIGIYKYQTKLQIEKVVPIVRIMDK